jgi:NTP pyrophosphatase (non-canonical NTP hydrolase)
METPPLATLNDLPAIAADIGEHLKAAGYTEKPHIRQTLALAEEVGEFVKAVRRYYGYARRRGTLDDIKAEGADVVITAFITAHEIGFDLVEAIAEKITEIYTRGWREEAGT